MVCYMDEVPQQGEVKASVCKYIQSFQHLLVGSSYFNAVFGTCVYMV